MNEEAKASFLLHALLDELFYALAVFLVSAVLREVEVVEDLLRSAWSVALSEEVIDLMTAHFDFLRLDFRLFGVILDYLTVDFAQVRVRSLQSLRVLLTFVTTHEALHVRCKTSFHCIVHNRCSTTSMLVRLYKKALLRALVNDIRCGAAINSTIHN